MQLTWGLVLLGAVLGVTCGPVRDAADHQTILELMAQDYRVCNFPPNEMLTTKSKARFLKPCRVEVEDDPSTEEQVLSDAQDDPSYLLCMGIYDVSAHICGSGVQLGALPNTSDQFVSLFSDDSHAEDFCTAAKQLEPLDAATGRTTLWVKVLNDKLADTEQCASLCVQTAPNGKMLVNHLCRIIVWGRNQLNSSGRSGDPGLEAQELADDGLTQNGAANMEPETPSSAMAADVSQTNSQSASPKVVVVNSSSQAPPKVNNVTQAASKPVPSNVSQVAPKSVSVSAPAASPSASSQSSSGAPVMPIAKSSSTKPTSKASSPEVSSPVSKDPQLGGVPDVPINPPQAPSSTEGFGGPVKDVIEEEPQRGGDKMDEGNEEGDDVEIDDDYSPINKIETPTNVASQPRQDKSFAAEDPVPNESNFYAYFFTMAVVCIVGYVAFHNKQKILALLLEGRRGSQGSRRRPNSSNYRKLNTNLEEAITSPAPRSTNSHVIY